MASSGRITRECSWSTPTAASRSLLSVEEEPGEGSVLSSGWAVRWVTVS